MRNGRIAASLFLVFAAAHGGALRADPPTDAHDDPFAGKSVLYRAAATGKAGTFLSAVWVAGLADALRGGEACTIFVPTDEAFARLPEGTLKALLRPEGEKKLAELLKYHVIRGKVLAREITGDPRPRTLAGPPLTIAANAHGIAVNEATVLQADLEGRNGVVHLIDRVLMPPKDGVLAVAEKAGGFRVLLKAVEAAGLSDALAGDGPFTILAPTDEAFAKLGRSTTSELLKDKKKLARVLSYHVIPGKLTARELVARGAAPTLLKSDVRADVKAGRVVVNKSNVIASDLEASNGIVHAIDAVLIPVER
ncbi:Cell surface lipoprotein MPB83 precursor [Aquisphaera giovannonii]|uniref:Cell surface lipoprotein MPB83 n=1 Tax=Aquisphaera giovannonii TaxID=406548 RepID=A0A5B9VUH9_9BACT|nr:fasciclin domain-containing protein [Aquisphaera giovannonii]QEH31918.1 Cell surface lipoprotein MPB83 precursor [Aquisphaera giovannonii]